MVCFAKWKGGEWGGGETCVPWQRQVPLQCLENDQKFLALAENIGLDA